MRVESRRGQNEKKWKKKHVLQFEKNILFTARLGLSFGFAFQRWFVELEKVLL
jgi:hypothetical protein